MLRITPAISAIVLAVASSVVLAGKVDLVWKFKAGDEGDYVLARNRVAKLDLNGNEIEIGVSSTVDMHFVVKSVEGDKATLAIKMDRLQMNVNSPSNKSPTIRPASSRERRVPSGPVSKEGSRNSSAPKRSSASPAKEHHRNQVTR